MWSVGKGVDSTMRAERTESARGGLGRGSANAPSIVAEDRLGALGAQPMAQDRASNFALYRGINQKIGSSKNALRRLMYIRCKMSTGIAESLRHSTHWNH